MSWIEKKSVPIQGDNLLRIIYIRVEDGVNWEENPKKHDIPLLRRSIKRYGFRDAPIWDDNLNGGEGGLAGGNGRLHTLVEMQDDPEEQTPQGIYLDAEGKWCFPLQIGINASSESEAIAFAVDHNQITLAGAGIPIPTQMQIWEGGVLKFLTGDGLVLPESVNSEMVEVLLAQEHVPTFDEVLEEFGEPEEEDFWSYIRVKAPSETHNLFHDVMKELDTEDELVAFQYCLIAGMEKLHEGTDRPSKTD